MDRDTKVPSNKIIRFPAPSRNSLAANEAAPAAGLGETCDRGPCPEESLRLMRAFVRIKNRQLRTELIAMLERASRARGPLPARGKE